MTTLQIRRTPSAFSITRRLAVLAVASFLPLAAHAQPATPAPAPGATPAPALPVAVSPSPAEMATTQGKVVRFTTAPRGEVDGAVLDNGTSLHWPPHLQGRFAKVLKAGDAVKATGRNETAPAGEKLFEIKSVTNTASNAVAENPDFDAAPPAPPVGPRDRRGPLAPPPPGGEAMPAAAGIGRGAPDPGRDRQLRDLQSQVDELKKEVAALKQAK